LSAVAVAVRVLQVVVLESFFSEPQRLFPVLLPSLQAGEVLGQAEVVVSRAVLLFLEI
jgi:hypothetical protein